jgi:hypothetical protein
LAPEVDGSEPSKKPLPILDLRLKVDESFVLPISQTDIDQGWLETIEFREESIEPDVYILDPRGGREESVHNRRERADRYCEVEFAQQRNSQ